MLNWALAFFLVALVAALFGFTGIALAAAGVVDSSDKAEEPNKRIRESARARLGDDQPPLGLRDCAVKNRKCLK
jgi:hypothetical protein